MFALPEDLPQGVEELASLLSEAEAEFDSINASFGEDGVPDESQLARLSELNAAAGTISAAMKAYEERKASAKAIADERAARKAAAATPAVEVVEDQTAKKKAPVVDEDEDGVPADEDEDDTDPEKGKKKGGKGNLANFGGKQAKPFTASTEDATESVTASVLAEKIAEQAAEIAELKASAVPDVSDFKGLASHAAPTAPSREVGFMLHRNAPGYNDHQGLIGYKELALIIERRSQVTNGAPDGRVPMSLATVDRGFAESQIIDSVDELVASIEDQTRDQNWSKAKFDNEGALTAAAGWCAPSETLYDFCDIAPASDLVSLPEVNMTRGGLRWPNEPDFTELYTQLDVFDYTEAELLTNPTKPCVEVPCPTLTEIRPDAIGICITAGILQKRGWPELIERFLKETMKAHQHRISRKTILTMVAGSTAFVVPAAGTLGAAGSVLNSLALAATNLRLADRRPKGAPVEGVAPTWLQEVIRSDIAYQQGGVPVWAVTDAQVDAALAVRGIRLQYVSDWQTRGVGEPGVIGTVAWPATVNVLLYAPGTWFRHLDNVIEMGMLYDKAQLQANRYTELFTEDEMFVAKRCWASWNVTVPICVSGEIGTRSTVTCNAA